MCIDQADPYGTSAWGKGQLILPPVSEECEGISKTAENKKNR